MMNDTYLYPYSSAEAKERDELSLMNFFNGHPAGEPGNPVSGQRRVADRLQIIHIEG